MRLGTLFFLALICCGCSETKPTTSPTQPPGNNATVPPPGAKVPKGNMIME